MLLYTAVTRARQLLLLVSTRAAVDRCLKNDITLTGAQASCVPRRVADLLRARGVACEEAAHPAAHAMRRAAAPGRPVSGAWPSLGRVAQAPPPGETSQGQRSDAAHVDAALDRAAASAPAPAPGPAAAPTPAPAPPRSPMPAQQRPSGRWAAPPSFHRPQVRIIHSGP
ncbi:hypothetical protein FOA52_009072 [Chlamydomonas sp. UWO 241]|nr:hypothetical protein FOA52_009072 [Chlamydomonas sp. UWO 241]